MERDNFRPCQRDREPNAMDELKALCVTGSLTLNTMNSAITRRLLVGPCFKHST